MTIVIAFLHSENNCVLKFVRPEGMSSHLLTSLPIISILHVYCVHSPVLF